MVLFAPEPLVVEDERSKDLMFLLIAKDEGFAFACLLEEWFNRDLDRLAAFLRALDDLGLKIDRKEPTCQTEKSVSRS